MKRILSLAAVALFSCSSHIIDPVAEPDSTSLISVDEYNWRYNSALTTTGSPVKTYIFNSDGHSEYYLSGPSDTSWNTTEYERMTSPAPSHFDGLGRYPAYDQIKVDMTLDPYGNVIHFKEVHLYETSADTTYVFYFVNHYRDGTTTGQFKN